MKELCLYLASASPRRRELLQQLGFAPRIVHHEVDETVLGDEPPGDHVRRLAREKARDAARRLVDAEDQGLILAADTVVTVHGEILGKPADAADALAMLRRLSGRPHEVLTAIFLRRTDDGRESGAVDSTRVIFRSLDEGTLDAYVRSGEPLDKAGAYGIQGRGAFLAERIEGSWSNVVGLPLERLPGCLAQIGVEPLGVFRGTLTSR